MKYLLDMDEEHAAIVQRALEFYSRMRMGQWQELIWLCLDMRDDKASEKRDFMETMLLVIRDQCYPELHHTFAHSYGVGNFQDADLAWEVYASIRHCAAWAKHPEGGWTVDFDEPMSFSGNEIAKCVAIEE